jgi:radical SAM protein with 4Fe4S-binding SPASM domain
MGRIVLWFNRLWNFSLILLSYFLSKKGWLNQPMGMPVSMSIEPTTACNLGCPECPSGLKSFQRKTGNLKLADLEKWLPKWKGHLTYLNFYFQGEPFIHPQLPQMIALASQHHIVTSISTNGHFLTDEVIDQIIEAKLSRLIISLDGFTQEVYEQYRVHGDVDKVKDAVVRVIQRKKEKGASHPQVVIQTLAVKPNESEIPLIKQWAKEVGADKVVVKTAQLYHPSDNHPLMTEDESLRRYLKDENGEWKIKNPLDNHCWRMWSGCVVTWNGDVVPCCFDKDAQHKMGSLQQSSLEAIWNDKTYEAFRLQLQRGRKEIDICANCSEGTKVWA